MRFIVGTHFPRANAITGYPSPTVDAQAKTVDALASLATATAANRATVATLTNTIARLSSELAAAQAKLISSLLDKQKLLKKLSERNGGRNTSRGGTDNATSGGAGNGPWDGPCIHYCHTSGFKCPHSSFHCPCPGPNHIKNATKKDTIQGTTKEYKKE